MGRAVVPRTHRSTGEQAMKTLRGVIRGMNIELNDSPELPEGQEVRVIIAPLLPDETERLPPGDGIGRSAGAWVEDEEELDKYLEWSRRQRKRNRREIES